jgi:hypothetical protein
MQTTLRWMIVSCLLISLALCSEARASERDGIDYYKAHLSEYKGKEIQVLAYDPYDIQEKSIKDGFVYTKIFTQDSIVHCLVKKDRIDAFMRRYKGYDKKILRGTLEVTERGNPYLVIDGF